MIATINSFGQLLSSLYVDHVGFLGIPRRPLSPQRAAGALLVMTGCVGASLDLVSVQTAQATAAGAAALSPLATAGLSLLYMVARMGQPVQACLNARLAEYLPAPAGSLAAFASFFVGGLATALCCAALFLRRPARYHATILALRRPWTGLRAWI